MKNLLQLIQLFVLLLIIYPAQADEIIQVNTRANVMQPVLLWEPYHQDAEFLIVFFPAGAGNIGIEWKNGRTGTAQDYFLSSQRALLRSPRFAVAVIDTPSDRKGMGEAFRQSEEHVTDIKNTVATLKQRFPQAKLVLMGHSRGTVSAGYLSRALADQIDATVLLAARYQAAERAVGAAPEAPGGSGLSEIDFSQLKKPVLLVHHVQDACVSTPFTDAEQQSKYAQLIKVDGHHEQQSSRPCASGTHHWFVGQEEMVGQEILKWLTQQ